MQRMTQKDATLVVRVPAGLKARLTEIAEDSMPVSMHAPYEKPELQVVGDRIRPLVRADLEAYLTATGTDEVWEFGAGTGALAHQVLTQLRAEGMAATVVNGAVLYEHGEHQGPMPGRALRSGEVVQ